MGCRMFTYQVLSNKIGLPRYPKKASFYYKMFFSYLFYLFDRKNKGFKCGSLLD
jgi:hypothetical protein